MDLSSVQDWKNAALAKTDDHDHIRAIDVLAKLLINEASPTTTAKVITTAYNLFVENSPGMEIDHKVNNFWALYFCDAVRTFGTARDRLIELIGEISRLLDVKRPDGSIAKDRNGAVYWRDLPALPWEIHDQALCYHDPGEHSPEELGDYLAQALYLLNGCRFAATLFAQDFVIKGMNWTMEANTFLEDGIENAYESKDHIKSQRLAAGFCGVAYDRRQKDT